MIMKWAEPLFELAVARFRTHFLIYIAAGVGAVALTAATGWHGMSWLMLVWGILLLVHYLVYKTGTVDERWVEERTEELELKSYDRDHIESIRSRYGGDDTPGGNPGRRR